MGNEWERRVILGKKVPVQTHHGFQLPFSNDKHRNISLFLVEGTPFSQEAQALLSEVETGRQSALPEATASWVPSAPSDQQVVPSGLGWHVL